MKFGTALKNQLKQEGMSVDNLAEKLGVTKQAVHSWIRGETKPAQEKLPAIRKETGLNLNELEF